MAGEMLLEGRSDPNFANIYASQLFWLLRERGQAAELEPLLRTSVEANPDIPAFRTALALIWAELDRRDEARGLLDQLVEDGFAVVPRNNAWPVSLALLAETSARVADPPTSAVLLDALRPHRGHLVVLGLAIISTGAVDRFLGMLAWHLGRFEEAEPFFRTALALEERIGAVPFVARTRFWYARMLLDRRSLQRQAVRPVRALVPVGELLAGLQAWVRGHVHEVHLRIIRRAVNGPHLVALVRAGATFDKGVMIERPTEPDQEAAA